MLNINKCRNGLYKFVLELDNVLIGNIVFEVNVTERTHKAFEDGILNFKNVLTSRQWVTVNGTPMETYYIDFPEEVNNY